MGLFKGSISAVAGSKMSTDYTWSMSPSPRRIRKILLTGGSAAGDTIVHVHAGQNKIATLYNIATDDIPLAEDMFNVGLYVAGGATIYAEVGATAAGSGTVYLWLDIVPSRVPVLGGFILMKSVTAAVCAANYDFLDDENIKSSTLPRVIRSAGLTGSAATGDTILEISAQNRLVGEVYNTSTGLAPMQHLDMHNVTAFVGRGAEIEVRCIDAAATNAVMFVLVLGGVTNRLQGFGNTFGNRFGGRSFRRY